MVSLTTPKFRVYAALGFSDNENLPFELSIKNQPEAGGKTQRNSTPTQKN
jgi:hypothetical protein